MARKKRDYKAEYAARKRKAQNAGYKSVKEYGRVRKELRTPRNASPIPRRIYEATAPQRANDSAMARLRRSAKKWSDDHSRVNRSRYRESFPDEQVRDYHGAFVAHGPEESRRKRAAGKRRRIKDYLETWFGVDETEWNQAYELQPV